MRAWGGVRGEGVEYQQDTIHIHIRNSRQCPPRAGFLVSLQGIPTCAGRSSDMAECARVSHERAISREMGSCDLCRYTYGTLFVVFNLAVTRALLIYIVAVRANKAQSQPVPSLPPSLTLALPLPVDFASLPSVLVFTPPSPHAHTCRAPPSAGGIPARSFPRCRGGRGY